ncbi:MAG: DNRLRE domain-containing protein, partial [Acidimicrobiia bacterium]
MEAALITRWLVALVVLAGVVAIGGMAVADTTTTVHPSADTFVSDGSPNGNYGSRDLLQMDAPLPNELRILLRFDPVPGTVTSATLRLFARNGGNDAGTLHAVDGTWNENTVTWSNAPAVGDELIDLPGAPSGWYEIDVTSLLQDGIWEYYLVPNSDNGIHYASKETTDLNLRPELVITTTDTTTTTQATTTEPPTTSSTTTTSSSTTTSTTSTTTTSTTSTSTTSTTSTTTTTLPPVELGPRFVVAGDIADCSWTRDSDTA